MKTHSIINVLLYIHFALIAIYLIGSITSYSQETEIVLRAMDRPILLYWVKWIYALALLKNIIYLRESTTHSFAILNMVCVAVILLFIMEKRFFLFYTYTIDNFLLELISISLLITINTRGFIKSYHIIRKPARYIYFFLIPGVVTTLIYLILLYRWPDF